MSVTWDHHQCIVLQCLQSCYLYIRHTNTYTFHQHSINAHNTHPHTTHTHTHTHTSAYTTHHSPLKSSVVSDVSDVKPSPMDCAPTSPMLLSVHPTHTNALNQHTNTYRIHHTSLTIQIQCCKWFVWLETTNNALRPNVANMVVCIFIHTFHQHTNTPHVTHKHQTTMWQTITPHITHHSNKVL